MSEEDPKAGNLIRNIWNGPEFTKCDGNIFGYSNMINILLTRAKRADASSTFFDIVSAGFENLLNVDYTFQFRYRSMAISAYFAKEILMAAVMVYVFRLVNEDYRKLFMGPLVYIGMIKDEETGEEKLGVTESVGFDTDNFPVEEQVTDPAERAKMMSAAKE